MKVVLVVVVVAFLMSSSALTAATAPGGHVSDAYLAYHAQQGGGMFTEAMCLAEESVRQDAVLNAEWRRTILAIPKSRASALRREEREWIARRDHLCDQEVVDDDVINSTAKLVWNQCEVDARIARVALLRRIRTGGPHGVKPVTGR